MDDAAFVDLVADVRARRASPASLVDLLAETAPIYAGRGAGEVARRKGWILAAFAHTGLPDTALPYVLEELDTAREPYVAAAAAMALRGARRWEPRFAGHLATAFSNMRERDDAVSFTGFRPDWSRGDTTTPLEEILITLSVATCSAAGAVLDELRRDVDDPVLSPTVRRRLQAIAPMAEQATVGQSCCHGDGADSTAAQTTTVTQLSPLALSGVHGQDQDGAGIDLESYLRGRITIVGFFYTRCENPYKCALTITKLGDVQRRLDGRDASRGIQVAAISYDPAYDTPRRLARYARTYRFTPSERDRLIRITTGERQLHAHFALNVGYAGTLVNRHGIELYLTGNDGHVVHSWQRQLWDVDEVAERARRLNEV